MCGNRVEELEEQVKELQASVEGLTDELVECKVRIRELENTVDEDSGFGADAGGNGAQSGADDRERQSAEDEILTPEDDTPNTEADDDADKEAEAASESESEEDSGSDIIVA